MGGETKVGKVDLKFPRENVDVIGDTMAMGALIDWLGMCEISLLRLIWPSKLFRALYHRPTTTGDDIASPL